MNDSYTNDDPAEMAPSDVVNDIARAAGLFEQADRKYYRRMADTFGLAGIYLIPNDWLPENTFMVSRKVYDAFLKYAGDKNDELEAKP